jgi:hypothetical protein
MGEFNVPEGLVKLAHALVEDLKLRNSFYALEKLPKRVRKQSFAQMAAQMRANGEDIDLTDAVFALARPKVYEAVLAAVRERVGENIVREKTRSSSDD